MHPFQNFVAVLPPPPRPTLYKVETKKKKFGDTRPTLFVAQEEGLDLCELEKRPRRAKVSQDFCP